MSLLLNFILAERDKISNPFNTSAAGNPADKLEGLRHGGWAQHMRRIFTEFGSGWQGPSFEQGLIGPGSINPVAGKPRLTLDRLNMGFVTHEIEDFSSSLPYYLLPDAEKIAQPRRLLPFLEKHWKAVSAVGLLGLYMSKPGALFSGRDDESNTIEGLRHGGLSQRMRRDMTPFGSGWDPMRALAREAGLSLEKFVAQPHFKLAMASGDVIRELGQGSYGKVHLMESSIRIGEREHTFQYARKTLFDRSDYASTFHEVRAQRKLQDLNSPSVYGWRGDQIFMEPFHGVAASSHMMRGEQLPESFISDLESFIPEMHRRGIAHRDIGRDFNKLVDKPGKMGEVIPHNIILTPEGRAGVIDYGMSTGSGAASPVEQSLHQLYNREKYSTNAELDMALVRSLRKNNGKLSATASQELTIYRATRKAPAVPSTKTMKAKIRTNTQAIATQKTAKNLFSIGRKSKSTFRSSAK